MNKSPGTSLNDASARRSPARQATSRLSPAPAPEGTTRVSDKIAALEAETALYRTALDQSRDEMQAFAYSVSHDLRAPLRAIEGFSKILVEDYSKSLDPEAQRFLKHIISNTETLGSQIEDLLRFYRIGRNPPTRLPVDTDAVCREVITTFSPAEAAKIHIPSRLPEVFADPVQLREVFSQLLGNALKFTAKSSNPRIEVVGAVEPRTARITVRDNGIGFDPKHAEKVFQVFQKLHASTEYPGNGIGLAIVKRVLQAHGGCVEVESAAGGGAAFSFTLPGQSSSPGKGQGEE